MEMTSREGHAERRSLPGLFSDLWRETCTLFRTETELAKAELSEKVSQIQTALVSLAIAGAILLAAVLLLLAAVVNGLALFLPPEHAGWLSPLIVGIVVGILGMLLLAKGRRDLEAENLKPARTMRSLRRDAQLTKEHFR